MKPLYLEIEGFLSYKEKTDIDFSELSLFAITGPTGAGKSSIIDAITFALYGKSPRFEKERSNDQYISKGKDYFKVALTFSLNNTIYKVERALKSGRNMVISVKKGDKELVTEERNKAKEEALQKLLGMDYETFTKVIMLPQGEFARFIKPDKPKERRDIIIELSNLKKIDKLKEIAAEKRKKLQDELNIVKSNIDSLKLNQEDIPQLQNQRSYLIKELEEKEAQKNILLKRLQEANRKEELTKKLDKLEYDYKSLKNQESNMNDLKNKIDYLRPKLSLQSDLERCLKIEKELNTLNAKLQNLSKDISDKKQKYELSLEAFKSIENEYQKIKEDEERAEKGRQIINILEKAIMIEKDKDSLKNDLYKKITNLQKIEQSIKELQSKIKEFVEDEKLSKEKDNLAYKIGQLKAKEQELTKKTKDYEKTLEEINAFKKDIEKIDKQIQSIEKELETHKKDIILYHSKILKTLLKENDICPVCGGVYHDKEHIEFVEAQGQEELFKRLDELKTKKNVLENSLINKKDQSLSLSQEIEKLKEELSQKDDITKAFEDIKQQIDIQSKLKELLKDKDRFDADIKELENKLKLKEGDLKAKEQELINTYNLKEEHLKNKNQTKERFEGKLQEIKKQIDDKRKNYERAKDDLNSTERDLKLLEQQKGSLEERKKDMDAEFSNLEEKLSSLEDKELILKELKSLETYENTYNNYIGVCKTLEGNISDIKNELSTIKETTPSIDLENDLNTIEKELKDMNKQIGAIDQKIEQANQNEQQIKELEKTFEELQRKISTYEKLEKDLKSDALQLYISQKIIDELVKYANDYALKMDFAYNFKVDEEKDEILVEDAFGNARSVRSLSGGESFISSLCFALALNETLSSNKLQSLFIDEGFGTLDQENLEKVGNALEQLSQNINKIVGIITHVENLAQRLPNRIKVFKTKEGISKIEIV